MGGEGYRVASESYRGGGAGPSIKGVAHAPRPTPQNAKGPGFIQGLRDGSISALAVSSETASSALWAYLIFVSL